MRKLLLRGPTATLIACIIALTVSFSSHAKSREGKQQVCTARQAVRFYSGRLTHWSHKLGTGEPRVTAVAPRTCPRYLAHVLQRRAYASRALFERLHDPRRAIRYVFGSYAQQAIGVASCESHLHTTARNGQYLGMFQMGSSERRIFGHGPTALEQAWAAWRYFDQSGRDWSPWSCRWAA